MMAETKRWERAAPEAPTAAEAAPSGAEAREPGTVCAKAEVGMRTASDRETSLVKGLFIVLSV